MRVLVTGASGFIGRAVVAGLKSNGHGVVGFDRHPKPIEGVSWTERADILDAEVLSGAVAECDGVINLAGLLGTSELLENTRAAVAANIQGALNVYEACLAWHKPVVQISPGNKDWLSVYPITKICAERLGLALGADAGLKIAVVRAMNVYGPWQKHAPVRKYIPNLIRWAFLREPARIYGSGEQVMDPVWVGDVAEILVRALEAASEGPVSGVLEAGTGVRMTANYVADVVWRALWGPAAGSMPKEQEPMRPGEPDASVTVADTATLKTIGIDSHSFVRFADGIARTVGWYQAHPEVLGLEKVEAIW